MDKRQQAQERVGVSSELQQYESTIMYEWPEGDEHWDWIATASIAEIIEWAKTIESDPAYCI